MIALAQAVLCEDCQQITAATNGHCPACQSTALMNLSKVLNREEPAMLLAVRDVVEELKRIANFLEEERKRTDEFQEHINSRGLDVNVHY